MTAGGDLGEDRIRQTLESARRKCGQQAGFVAEEVCGRCVRDAGPPRDIAKGERTYGTLPAELESDAAEKIQRQHLGHLAAMRAAGHLLVAGPLRNQPDPRLRGICLYRTGSIATALELASSDPAVRAGQLKVEAMAWFTRAGALAFPGIG